MANILMTYSGGINSTYGLWKWLSNTSHNITAVYSVEDWLKFKYSDADEREVRQKNGADAVVAWLKSNVRDFTYETVTWPMSYTENRQPIREGFSFHMDVGHLEPRYHGLKQLIDSRSPDGVVVGMSLETTSHDCSYGAFRSHIETEGVDIYLAGSRDFSPVPKGDSFSWDVVAPPLSGRFEQWAALPNELSALIPASCPVFHDPRTYTGSACLSCHYLAVRDEVTDKTPAEIDAVFAEEGCYGQWRGNADPGSYIYRGNPILIARNLLKLNE